METNKLIAGIVAAAIAIIVLAGVLMPALSNATATEDTIRNQGYFYVDDPTDEIVLSLSDGVLKVNGTSVNPPDDQTYPDGVTILYTENAIIRYYENELRSRGGLIGYHAFDDCELTFNNGTLTGTYTSIDSETPTSVNTTYTALTVIYPEETETIMCKPVSQYVNKTSEISGAGVISTPNNSTKYWVGEFSGSINDGITAKIFGQSTGAEPTSTTVENAKINYETVSTHEDLYQIQSITFDVVSVNDPTIKDTVTFTIYLTPSEVTAERAIQLDPAMNMILNAIPVFILIAVLLGVVAIFIIRRE